MATLNQDCPLFRIAPHTLRPRSPANSTVIATASGQCSRGSVQRKAGAVGRRRTTKLRKFLGTANLCSIVGLLLMCGLLSACNNPAVRGPRTNPTYNNEPSTGQTENLNTPGVVPATSQRVVPTKPQPTRKRYSWTLPKGDESTNPIDNMYSLLYSHNCDDAQTALEAPPPGPGGWSAFGSPRDVLLFQANIYLCRDTAQSTSAGIGMFQRAESTYGWKGTKANQDICQLYQAAVSVANQSPPSNFPCLSGRAPAWGNPMVNPLNPTESWSPDEPPESPTSNPS